MQSLTEHDPRQIGSYLLRARLGDDQDAGYLAVAPDGSKVTLRVLREGARFVQEVEAATQDDPGWMARVLDADVEDSLPYIVSEFGESHDPATSSRLVGAATALAKGLAAIHRAGLGEPAEQPADVLAWGRAVH
ncbi:MAG: serine/threonine protein kinase, partial [Thermoactinospora sp.]|nr:serine/threonine protein kinase [Thermoactinospora sp.]